MGNEGGNYSGYPGSKYWNVDSRPLSEATNVLRSFVLQNIVQDNQWEIDRITKYYLYWKFYESKHYKDFNDGMLSFNYVRAFIDKINMFLLGKDAFTFNVGSYYSTQVSNEIEKVAEELLMYHWNKSKKKEIAYEMLQMGGITGDCWVGLQWIEEEKYCRVSVYDSRQCFVKFKNGNRDEVESIMLRQTLEENRSGFKLFVQKWSADKIEVWYQKDVSLDEGSVVKESHKEMENPYGFIPIVHIKNKVNSSGYYGLSDMNDILKINKVYDELNQQIKAVIDYHVTPTTIITGASAKSLKRGLGQIWSGLPAEANVFNLGLDVDLSAATNFAKDMKTAMHELSDVPENALGKIQAISNTSAAALQITYQPLIQQAEMKELTYGEGITELNRLILKIMQVHNPQDERLKALLDMEPNFITDMYVEPVFAYGFPKDRLDELNKAQMELNLKLGSRREIMDRMGKQNVPELMKEIDDDAMQQGVLMAQIQQMAMSASMGGAAPMGEQNEPTNGGEEDVVGGEGDNNLPTPTDEE